MAIPSLQSVIKSQKEHILEKWEKRARAEIPAARDSSKLRLRDSLPDFLDLIADCMQFSSPEEVTNHYQGYLARKHGRERSDEPEYNLEQVIDEYYYLRLTLIETLDAHKLAQQQLEFIQMIIHLGLKEATTEFLLQRKVNDEKLDRKLRETTENLRLILEGIRNHAVIQFKPDGEITSWNKGAENIFGWKEADVVGLQGDIIFTPEDRTMEVPRQELETAKFYGKADDYRWHIRKDGVRFFGAGTMNSIYSETGDVIGLVKVLSDDTIRLTLEKERENREKELIELFMQAPVCMAMLDGNKMVFTFANKKFEEAVDRKVTGKKVIEAFTKEEHSQFLPLLEKVYQSGKDFHGKEVPLHRNIDGKETVIYNNFTYHPVKDIQGNVIRIMIVMFDVTEQVEARNISEKEKDLREKFIATLSHDLRTPLTAAKISAQMLARKSNDPILTQKFSLRIIDNMDRADNMIRDLLDANMIKAGEKLQLQIEQCDIVLLLEDAISELASVHGDVFRLITPETCVAHCNHDAIRRIVENLCTNAIKYGTPGKRIEVLLRQSPAHYIISVTNKGPEIPNDDLPYLFEPFKRAKQSQTKKQKGWGLGLTLVKGLTEAHEGRVTVESRENKTTFTVTLPK